MSIRTLPLFLMASLAIWAQGPPPPDQQKPEQNGSPGVEGSAAKSYRVDPGTRIPLSLINSVSTKHAAQGDRVYLESVFPILVQGRVVIPPGSYVAGTITEVKRPGKVKGRGEFYIRFDSITLPNGVTRDFRGRIGSLDGSANDELDRKEGAVKGEGNKTGDARTVAEAGAAGASIGAIAGSAAGSGGMGAGLGAAAGATAGLVGVLLSRGPDAILAKGTTVEMVLDRPLVFQASELDFSNSMHHVSNTGRGPMPGSKQNSGRRGPLGRFPMIW